MLKFFKDFLIYGFTSVLGKIAVVFLMPIYTSILTREEYGAMAMLISVKGIIDLFSNLNIHSGVARDYYEDKIDRKVLISTGIWSILGISLSIMIIMLTFRHFITEKMLGLLDYDLCFILLLLSMPTGSLMSYFSILTRYKKKPILYSIGSILTLIIQLTIAITTIVFLHTGIVGFFAATLISEIIAIIYYGYINREYISFNFNIYYLKRVLLYSIPTLPAILAGWIDSSLGQILIGKYISLKDLGIYSVALQFASVFTLVSMALNNVWGPFLFENYKKEGFQNEVNRLFIIFVSILTAISSIVSLFSPEFILILSNENYLDATKYLTLLCFPMSIYLLYPLASSGISISRETKHIGISCIIGSTINLFLLFIFVPICGIYIVPIGLGISRFITYLYLTTITKKKNLLTLPNKYLLWIIFPIPLYFFINYNQINLGLRIMLVIISLLGIFIFTEKKSGLHLIDFIKLRFKRVL